MPTKNKISRKPVNELGIAIQGYEGSFHQVAARTIFGNEVEVVPCANFRDLVKVAENKKESAGAMMAIENSIAGSILPNYNLLLGSKLKVTGINQRVSEAARLGFKRAIVPIGSDLKISGIEILEAARLEQAISKVKIN